MTDGQVLSLLEGGLAAYCGAVIGGLSTVLLPRLSSIDPSTPFLDQVDAVSNPGSACICGRLLGWSEKAPILGWLACGGRCRTCGVKVPPAFPMAEAFVMAVVFSMVGTGFGIPILPYLAFHLLPAMVVAIGAILQPVRSHAGLGLLLAGAFFGCVLHASLLGTLALGTALVIPEDRLKIPLIAAAAGAFGGAIGSIAAFCLAFSAAEAFRQKLWIQD